ncbi:olfactory receptor 1L4-like [Pelodytes ibericus]
MDNHTQDPDFYILAFASSGGKQVPLFAVFFTLYLICLLWNSLIIVIIYMDLHLQTPMYFFLCNLSFVDMSYTSVTLPKLLDIFLTGNHRISFTACFVQFYFFTSMACTEILLLTVMAYDRYAAICKSLHYPLIMNRRSCVVFLLGSWTSGYCNSLFITVVATQITFCGPKFLDQLFCDIKPMLQISCGGTVTFLTMMYLETFFMGFCPFLCIILSYMQIITNIMKVNVRGNRRKAFSTCTSHLTIIAIFYGTLFFVYMMPLSANFGIVNKMFSVLYLAVTPTLNPLIYSLRNKDMKRALQRKVKMFSSRLLA